MLASARSTAPLLAQVPGSLRARSLLGTWTASRTTPCACRCTCTRSSALVDDMLHYFDRMSMAHSLEVRVPFLDHELVELAATIPARLKVRRRVTKVVLKEAGAGCCRTRSSTSRRWASSTQRCHSGSSRADGRSSRRGSSRLSRLRRAVRPSRALPSRSGGRARRGRALTSADRNPDARVVAVDGLAAGDGRADSNSRMMSARSLSCAS